MVLGSARGLVVPPGLPAWIRDALRVAIAAATADPAWTAEAERLNLPLKPMAAEAQLELPAHERTALSPPFRQQRAYRNTGASVPFDYAIKSHGLGCKSGFS